MKLRSIYPMILVPLLGLIIIGTVLWAYLSPFTHATSQDGRVLLPSSMEKYTSKSHVLAKAASGQQVSLAVGLSLRNQAELAAYLQQITTPHSPLYHHYLNPATFAALYGPLPSSEAAVIAYLRSQGFTITATYPNHLVVDAQGSVAQAEQAFQVQINNYQAQNGRRFFANAGAPSLPSPLAPLVASVQGLDNLVQYGRLPLSHGHAKTVFAPKKTAHQAPIKGKASTISASANNSITCPQPGPATLPTAYTPAQIATAYDFTKLYASGSLGEGQTVGLLELDGFSPNDIALYGSCFGGKNTTIQTIHIDGYNGAAGANAAEVELDMEMVLGLAPRLASLRVYEASISSLAGYNDAWAPIIND